MDGNGRYAKKHHLPTIEGHRKGADTLKKIVKSCLEQSIPHATFYAFSTENWKRPKLFLDQYFCLANHYLKNEKKLFIDNQVKVKAIGDLSKLPSATRTFLNELEHETAHFSKLQVNLALSYGSRDEIVRACRKIATLAKEGQLELEAIDESLFDSFLDTQGIPPVDIMIRTSGEQRLSNYLLYQMAYAELYFVDTLWPDFSEDEFLKVLSDFSHRERRYGNYSDAA